VFAVRALVLEGTAASTAAPGKATEEPCDTSKETTNEHDPEESAVSSLIL